MAQSALIAAAAATPGGLEKAAILLLTLGSETAAAVFRHLGEQEVRQLSAAMARLRTIPRAHAAAVHEEAWRWLTSREGFLVDGEQFARQLIAARAAATGSESAAVRDLPRHHDSTRDRLAAQLEPLPPNVVAQILASEHPQVIAFVLSQLGSKQAAAVLGKLPDELAPDVLHRISELKNVPDELLEEVSAVLTREVQGLAPSGAEPVSAGAAKRAADIMNAAEKSVESRVFTYLDEQAPEVAETIRNLMLTFEDMIRLENRDLQNLLKEVPREDLMLALKTASPPMRTKIFANVSKRAAEIMQDDMSQMGPVKLKDVERAQQNIVAVARRLAEEGKITLGGGGDDVV
jgi:flagellar motor switch protein FliG